jgi:hypothetical protein
MNRFGLGPSRVGRLIGYDHASAINSNKIVKDMLLTKNTHFLDEIVRWAEVFDDVLPNDNLSNIIIQERVERLMLSLTDDRGAILNTLENLLEKYSKETADLELSGVI